MNAPRVTIEAIEANIASEHFFTAYEGVLGERFHHEGATDNDSNEGEIPDPLKLMTFCVLVLRNGYTVIGQSACASSQNFNKEMGQAIARTKAIESIWPLMGYELRTHLFNEGLRASREQKASDGSSARSEAKGESERSEAVKQSAPKPNSEPKAPSPEPSPFKTNSGNTGNPFIGDN